MLLKKQIRFKYFSKDNYLRRTQVNKIIESKAEELMFFLNDLKADKRVCIKYKQIMPETNTYILFVT